MSQYFDRIKRNPNKFGGQPYIHKTDVTINQIVLRSMQGETVQDILDAYPQLLVDDIHQALSFSIIDIFRGVSYWRHDGMTPLTQIKGYSEILVGKTEFGDLDTIPEEQKHQWMSVIHSSCQRGIARWQQMTQWMSKHYMLDTDLESEVYSIEAFLMEVITTGQTYEPTLQIDSTEVDPNLSIETHSDTALILGSILAFAKNTFKSQTAIHLEIKSDHVVINIYRELIYSDDDIEKLLSNPYSPVATALTFFYIQNITFEINREDDTIIFSVILPLWHE